MNLFKTQELQVLLGIKHGRGFGFASEPLVVVGILEGVKLESLEAEPSSDPEFDTDLVWKISSKHLRRLRTWNTVIKIECFSFSGSTRTRLGYLLLNLKEAQILPTEMKKMPETSWHKLLGVRKKVKDYNPEISLIFKIEEADAKETLKKPKKISKKKEPECIPKNANNTFGPPEISNDLFEFSIFVKEARNFNLDKSQRFPIEVKYPFMGKTLTIELKDSLEGFQSTTEIVEIHSRADYLSTYFKDFPILIFEIQYNQKDYGVAQMNIESLEDIKKGKEVILTSTLPISSIDGAINDIADFLRPFLLVQAKITPKEPISSPLQSIVSKPEDIGNVDFQEQFLELKYSDSPKLYRTKLTLQDLLDDKGQAVPECAAAAGDSLQMSIENEHQSYDEVQEGLREQNFKMLPALICSDTMSSPCLSPEILPAEYIKDTARRACEAIEEWKEQQNEIHRAELQYKREQLLKKLTDDLKKRQKEAESSFEKQFEICKILRDQLVQGVKLYSLRFDAVNLKESEFMKLRDHYNKKYMLKLHELRKASVKYQYDMEDKIQQCKLARNKSNKKIDELKMEKFNLKKALKDKESLGNASTLLNELNDLKLKLDKTRESKNFFKEVWGQTFRELQSIKGHEQQMFKIEFLREVLELQNAGLVQEIAGEVGELSNAPKMPIM